MKQNQIILPGAALTDLYPLRYMTVTERGVQIVEKPCHIVRFTSNSPPEGSPVIQGDAQPTMARVDDLYPIRFFTVRGNIFHAVTNLLEDRVIFSLVG